MSLTICPQPHLQFLSNAGAVLANGFLYTYAAGTDDALATYSDEDGTVENANPILLNSAGRPWNSTVEVNVYLLPRDYKFVLKNSVGTTIWTADHIPAVPTLETALDITGTAGEALSIRDVAYLSAGDGGKTAGSWYKTDADNEYSSSTAGMVAVVTATVASGEDGTFRLQGRITGYSALSAGADYYVSATAGAITVTAPINVRVVGQADSTTSLVVSPNPAAPLVTQPLNVCEGRLTLTTGVPVTTADVTGATSIFYAPYKGNRIALYDGTATWNIRTFTQITIALGTLSSGLPYDLFAYDNAGVVTFDSPVAWTNGTTRATALTTQNGVLVKTGATTRRYIGTFYTTATTTTEDSFAKRFLWNYYNRVTRLLRVLEATDSWTYSTNTYQQARATATNQLDIVIGVAEVALSVHVAGAASDGTGPANIYVSIGQDAITPTTGVSGQRTSTMVTSQVAMVSADLVLFPAVGRHYYTWLEKANPSGTVTWYGDNGSTTDTQNGISGAIAG